MSMSIIQGRMLEQAESWTPWHRRAWEPGTILRLREYIDALHWVERGVLSSGAASWLRKSLQPLLGRDLGLGDGAVRSQLQGLLKRDMKYGSPQQRRLSVLVDYADHRYLPAWRDALSTGEQIDVERASRFIVTHVIDCGFDASWLRGEIKEATRKGADPSQLIDLLVALVRQPARTFTGVVPLTTVPHPEIMQAHPDWLGPRETNIAIVASGGQPTRAQTGSLRFEVERRDPIDASHEVFAMMERLTARTRFSRSRDILEYVPKWYVEGFDRPFTLRSATGNVSAMTLTKTGRLYSGSTSTSINDAIQLAAALFSGPNSIAASGGWAAIESLLTANDDWSDHGGRANAADRAASILAAAWPRAEATTLSYWLSKGTHVDKRLRLELDQAGTDNVARCGITMRAIEAGSVALTGDALIDAAILRMQSLQQNPRPTLRRIEEYMTSALRRLYRQRNIVLHGGADRSLALNPTIRTVGPLVGAVIDRLSHGVEVAGMQPLDVAAHSRAALNAVGQSGGWPLHALGPDDFSAFAGNIS